MKTFTNTRSLPTSRLTVNRLTPDRLTLVWAMLRAVLFIWMGVHCTNFALHAQSASGKRLQIPVVMGNNIVGRVVESNAQSEAMMGVQVRIVEADITATLDRNGYFTATNIMNGKYTVQVLADGSGEILATQTITLRGNDVCIPPITLERGEYVLCGRVTYADNRSLGVANVSVKLGNGASVTTDAHGSTLSIIFATMLPIR
jgi:Carboxypeptidase regulatory-like domain